MWTTSVKIDEAVKLVEFWGLEFVNILFVYNKRNKNKNTLIHGFGYYTRG